MKLILGFVAAPVIFVVVLLVIVAGAASSGSAATGCGTASTAGGGATGTLPASVGRWKGDQLVMAATLLNAAAKAGVNQQAQTILIMTAMGESSLSNPDHGDAVDNTTIGVLQQGASYGPREARLDPATAATAFLTRLVQLPGWEGLEPTIAAHRVQINADPYHYAPFWGDAQAVVAALTGKTVTSGCSATGDARQLAQTLIDARTQGRLTDYEPAMLDELNAIAAGTATDGCQIDVRVLQLLVVVLNHYGRVAISDLNRECVNVGISCAGSSHCTRPSIAVDFNAVGGRTVVGGDATSLELLAFLDPILPAGARAGQVNCRAPVQLVNMTQFDDSCDHLHIDVGRTGKPLTLPHN